MKEYSIGIVGYGGFGQFLHANWSQMDGVYVAAICDQDEGIHVEDIPVFHTLEALLDHGVDIISISTPPSTHIGLAMQAIRAGKHVLVEKPMALSPEEVQQILDEAERYGVKVSTNYMLRFDPLVGAVKRITEQGLLGDLIYVNVVNVAQDESLPLEHWFWDKGVSGGILIEHAVHFFDLVYFVSGLKASGVEGFSSWRNRSQEDRVLGTVKHEGGLLASHFHAFCRPGFMEKTSIEFVFQYGTIRLHGWIPLKGEFSGLWNSDLSEVLSSFTEFEFVEQEEIGSGVDESRPEGWGDSGAQGDNRHNLGDFTSVAKVKFGLTDSKSMVYGACVRASLMDLLKKIENENDSCIDAKAMIEALRIARGASVKSNSARQK